MYIWPLASIKLMFVECLMIYFKDESSQVKSKGFHLVCPVRACVLSVVEICRVIQGSPKVY